MTEGSMVISSQFFITMVLIEQNNCWKWWHTPNSQRSGGRGMCCCEIDASLVYTVSSRSTKVTWWVTFKKPKFLKRKRKDKGNWKCLSLQGKLRTQISNLFRKQLLQSPPRTERERESNWYFPLIVSRYWEECEEEETTEWVLAYSEGSRTSWRWWIWNTRYTDDPKGFVFMSYVKLR